MRNNDFITNNLLVPKFRLQSNPTAKYEKNLCLALLTLCANHGGDILVNQLDAIQPGLSGQVIGHAIVKRLCQISIEEDRRVAAVGSVRLLCNTPAMIQHIDVWAGLLRELVKMLESPTSKEVQDEEAEMEAIEAAAVSGQSGASYSKLHFANLGSTDKFASLPPSKQLLANELSTLVRVS
jgi:hypothetical protein